MFVSSIDPNRKLLRKKSHVGKVDTRPSIEGFCESKLCFVKSVAFRPSLLKHTISASKWIWEHFLFASGPFSDLSRTAFFIELK